MRRKDVTEEREKNAREEYVAMSSAQAEPMTVMFGCWLFNCVEEPLSVRPDIEKASTSPISLPYSDRDTKREREREIEKREKNETRTYTEKRIDSVCCC